MIRPKHFGFNPETADNNTFQQADPSADRSVISQKAREEFDLLVSVLMGAGVHVDVIEDSDEPPKPDAVFPNNWFSTHRDGTLITFPMYSKLRRLERRDEILQAIAGKYDVEKRYAFEQFEEQEMFLEGTGSMVLDRENRIVYACLSDRTDIRMIDKFCVLRGYTAVTFTAVADGVRIYHTNVVMALGTDYVVICLECVPDPDQRQELMESFRSTAKEVIAITLPQLNAFAGNMLQLQTVAGDPVCVMSTSAYESLTPEQIMRIRKHTRIVHTPIPTIEKYGGGSARCMIAENFLKPVAR